MTARVDRHSLQLAAQGQRQQAAAELLHAFRQIPDEWKPDALSQVQLLARITNLPSARTIGEDQEA